MSRGGDEVQTAVDPAVGHLASVDPGLRVQVVLKLAVYVVDDRLPAEEQTGVVSGEQQTWGGPSRCVGGGGPRPEPSSPVAVVHSVAEAGSVDNGEQQLDASLLHQDLGLLHLSRGREDRKHTCSIGFNAAFTCARNTGEATPAPRVSSRVPPAQRKRVEKMADCPRTRK